MKFLLLLFTVLLPLSAQPALPDDPYLRSVEEWHRARINGLKREHSWVSLIALDWLKQGEQTVPGVGTLTLSGSVVILRVEQGRTATLNGQPFSADTVTPDKDKIIVGPKAAAVIERGGRFAVRVWDADVPARKAFTGIERYPVDPQWRIEARWIAYTTPKTIEIPTVIPDLLQEGIVPGVAVFTIDGKEYRLEPTIEEGSDELFFVFGDRTNGKETYGAGRFLYSAAPKEGKVILDFNRSYNPPCVFTDYATCPVPLPENRLNVRIPAGEKNFRHH
ncbi:MAG: DUF1684 domain-containing protein [Bacteroidetes bacterium]|nr:DUF1684 domain-containing protein [Bacteroidota bacterium]